MLTSYSSLSSSTSNSLPLALDSGFSFRLLPETGKFDFLPIGLSDELSSCRFLWGGRARWGVSKMFLPGVEQSCGLFLRSGVVFLGGVLQF
jgi:hypothetical protein